MTAAVASMGASRNLAESQEIGANALLGGSNIDARRAWLAPFFHPNHPNQLHDEDVGKKNPEKPWGK